MDMELLPEAKFEHGQIMATDGVHDFMKMNDEFKAFVAKSLARYFLCNWGDTNANDWHINDLAVRNNQRILAVYKFRKGPKSQHRDIWILTPHERTHTTILFPEEY